MYVFFCLLGLDALFMFLPWSISMRRSCLFLAQSRCLVHVSFTSLRKLALNLALLRLIRMPMALR
jgi:hypothetical protein